MKELELQVEWHDGDIYWRDVVSNRIILRSVKFSKYGDSNNRVLYYLEADEILPQYRYLARTDSSLLKNNEDVVIGVAVIGNRLYVQLSNGYSLYQLSKFYKNTNTPEQIDSFRELMEYNELVD